MSATRYLLDTDFFMVKRFIHIGVNECVTAAPTKERLEALAFALLIKLTFVDSTIKNTSIRHLTYNLRMGWTRLSRMLKNALRYGYIVKEGDAYFAPSLKQRGSFNYKAKFDLPSISKTEDGRTAYKLSFLMDYIRKIVFYNHIKKQDAFRDTALVVKSPSNKKEFDAKRKRLKRMCGITSVSDDMLKGAKRLSIRRAMTIMGTKRSKTKSLIKGMISEKAIVRRFENIPVGIDHKQLEKDYAMNQAVYAANKFGGHIHIFKGAVYIQVANHYDLCDGVPELITYSPKIKK